MEIPPEVLTWWERDPNLRRTYSGVPMGNPFHPATGKSIIELYNETIRTPILNLPIEKFVFDRDIFLHAESEIAEDNYDLVIPSGSLNDYTDGFEFGSELIEVFGKGKTLLDLGCATGTVPMTMRKAGLLAVGLEGSNRPRDEKIGAWKAMPQIVRCADISRPFEITDIDNNIIKFDYITSWGVFEHVHPDRLDILFQNCLNHLKDDGSMIANIDRGACPWHLTGGQDWQFWRERLMKYFKIDEITMIGWDWHFPRPTKDEIAGSKSQYGRLATGKDGRTYFWLRKKEFNVKNW